MMKSENLRFWRIVWYHKSGYSAPQYHVETTIKDVDKAKFEAIRLAKAKSTFTRFPKIWYFKIVLLNEDERN